MAEDAEDIKRSIVVEVLKRFALFKKGYFVPAAVSARHVHLSGEHVEALFGKGHRLNRAWDLSQPGQFACEERVALIGLKGSFENVRVLGPERKETQVEVSVTDCYRIGIKPAVRMSGDIAGTPGCTLVGPAGEVKLDKGVIVAARHLHISDEEAAAFGLKNGDIVGAKKKGERETVFGNIIVRAGREHSLELHLDTDEANAAGITGGELLELVGRG